MVECLVATCWIMANHGITILSASLPSTGLSMDQIASEASTDELHCLKYVTPDLELNFLFCMLI